MITKLKSSFFGFDLKSNFVKLSYNKYNNKQHHQEDEGSNEHTFGVSINVSTNEFDNISVFKSIEQISFMDKLTSQLQLQYLIR